MKDFYDALHRTAEQIGLNIITDDHCCKLLAWLYAYGGSLEAVVYNQKLNVDIHAAQRRLNIGGGLVPNKDLFPKLQGYLKEVEPLMRGKSPFQHPQFAYDIAEYYELKTHHIDGGKPYDPDDYMADLLKQGMKRKKK